MCHNDSAQIPPQKQTIPPEAGECYGQEGRSDQTNQCGRINLSIRQASAEEVVGIEMDPIYSLHTLEQTSDENDVVLAKIAWVVGEIEANRFGMTLVQCFIAALETSDIEEFKNTILLCEQSHDPQWLQDMRKISEFIAGLPLKRREFASQVLRLLLPTREQCQNLYRRVSP